MNCQGFWKELPQNPDHLRECAACAARYERQERLGAGLRNLGRELHRVEAPPRVERRLTAAFRGQASLGVLPGRSGWAPAVVWGAAIAAMLLLGVVLVRG